MPVAVTPREPAAPAPRVLLVSAPWMVPTSTSLAVGTLRPILEQAGIACDALAGSLLFPRTERHSRFLEGYAQFLFVPALYPDVDRDALVDRILAVHRDHLTLGGLWHPASLTLADLGVDEAQARRDLLEDMARAERCVDRCVAVAARPEYDVVAFSMTFETQVPGALAIARRVRAVRPSVRIAFGGAACFEEQGDGMVASFPDVDAVCHTEGEAVVVPLVRALRGERSLADVPGIAWRRDGAVVHNPSPPQLRDLDTLPIPEYDGFLQQLAASEYAEQAPMIFFETSRGCWWGEKHLCSFCGLNAEGLGFRRKSPERAYQEIATLYRRYPQGHYLQATDNIVSMDYVKRLFPRLATLETDPGRPLRMFFEVKANLRPDQLAVLAAGGVDAVQPGIESFDDAILALMNKGCTGLGQVEFIKWAQEAGIRSLYNLLIGNPGEQAPSYDAMTELVPSLLHLPPPSSITRTELERFSPHHLTPERFGITNIRPKDWYSALYRDPGADLVRLSYRFDYDHAMLGDETLLAAYRRFTTVVRHWIESYTPNQAFYVERGDHLVVIDRRSGTERHSVVAGPAADVFRYLDRTRKLAALRQRFSALDGDALDCLLDTWRHRRWVVRDRSDRLLCVLPAHGRHAPLPERELEANGRPQILVA